MWKIIFMIMTLTATACQTIQEESCPTDLGFKPGEECYRWDVNVPDIIYGRYAKQEAALVIIHALIHKEGAGHDL